MTGSLCQHPGGRAISKGSGELLAGVHGKYILRLDDACEKRDIDKWDRMEELLDRYKVKPLVGIIPHCEDPAMDEYLPDPEFWYRVDNWIEKGWTIAMHGFNHVYSNHNGGINPALLQKLVTDIEKTT